VRREKPNSPLHLRMRAAFRCARVDYLISIIMSGGVQRGHTAEPLGATSLSLGDPISYWVRNPLVIRAERSREESRRWG
jgi:hypothetical protein